MMKVIIVDDEPKAIDLLRGYLLRFENIEIAGTFRNGITALAFVDSNPVDLILLDINMPHLSGLAFAKSLKTNSKIIFTTAYSEYAAESYDIEAVDYLLKPISFERFARAIRKANQDHEDLIIPKNLFVKSGQQIHRVNPHEILYLEKDGNYITFNLQNSKILGRYSISEVLNILPDYFIQVHKSFIVNTEIIDMINKSEIKMKQHLIPIVLSFKANLDLVINKKYKH